MSDISRNFTSDEREKLRACGGHTYVTQRRENASGRLHGGGKGDNRGGRSNRGGRNYHGGQYNNSTTSDSNEPRNVSVVNSTNSTKIVECDASNTTIATESSSSGRGRQSGGRFGPRRSDWLTPPMSVAGSMALGCRRVATVTSANRHRMVQAIGTNTTNDVIAGTEARCEMDTHTNTCIARPNFVVVEYTGEHCNVAPYSYEYKPITDVPIVVAATAYTDPKTGETLMLRFTDPKTGETLMLRFNQALW